VILWSTGGKWEMQMPPALERPSHALVVTVAKGSSYVEIWNC
jgi:hypothetical protein